MGLDRRDGYPVLTELHLEYGLVCTARFGNGRLGSAAQNCDGLARYHELPQVNGYPFHPSEQDMIFVAGIKDQVLTIIVSMMLIEFCAGCPLNVNTVATIFAHRPLARTSRERLMRSCVA